MRGFFCFPPLSKKHTIFLGLASLVSITVYLLASQFYYRIGFPLDDSWIHQTYARNLAVFGEWAFTPGKPSAGSTSPLWTALLSVGFIFKLGPYLWAYLLGAVILWGMGLLGEMILRQVSPAYQPRLPWGGLFLVCEWHLVWSAASGMETILHALLITMVLGMLISGSRRFITMGLLVGLSIWVRPDGITLVGPVTFYALAEPAFRNMRSRYLGLFIIGMLVLFVPYLLFNLVLSDTPMPNTFYAKQAEYAAWQSLPLWNRFGRLSLQFLAGPSLVLFPAVLGWVVALLRRKDWGMLAGIAWFIGYLFLYIERLPVYQHGRYFIPAMPVFFLWGLAALDLVRRSISTDRLKWTVSTGWNILVGGLCFAFWLFGAWTYAQDVAIIESEMVVTAKWVAANVPHGELVAAHDIGALGYFDHHELVDLAGLISPEVTPFIRDEVRLAEYLDHVGATYLIAFPEFYPYLSRQAEPVFKSGGPFSLLSGGENMVVYLWRKK